MLIRINYLYYINGIVKIHPIDGVIECHSMNVQMHVPWIRDSFVYMYKKRNDHNARILNVSCINVDHRAKLQNKLKSSTSAINA